MPHIKPFRGMRYDGAELSAVVAPPYDVIDDDLRGVLYDRDPRNVIRLILGRNPDPYAEAAAFLSGGRSTGLLKFDREPAIYLLDQTFSSTGGANLTRKGFIAACRLEPFGGSVLPHEKTHSGPKEDRLKLMRSTGMMFSQIFSLYSDPGRIIDRRLDEVRGGPPDVTALFDGVESRLWVCTDRSAILETAGHIAGKAALIADGHHRYETALAYAAQCRMRNPGHTGSEPYNFVPMFFANAHDPGTIVYPTHRIVHSLKPFDEKEFLARLGRHFEILPATSEADLLKRLDADTGTSIGMVVEGGRRQALLRLRGDSGGFLAGVPPLLAVMDVTVLHEVILKGLLGMSDESQTRKANLDYLRDAGAAVAAVRSGAAQAAFLLKSPNVEQIRLAAEAGFVMPQKTTYFYPKLLSGMVMYSFEGAG